MSYTSSVTSKTWVCTYGDIIRRHRDEHAIVWLRGAIETGDTQAVIEHFLRLQPTSA